MLLQVLLATGGGHLVYLEIGDGVLTEVKHAQLEYEISSLDINPIGQNPNYSQLAAVGMWTDISVRIFSLPDLNLITKENLGGEIIPRSVLLCSFEGVSSSACLYESIFMQLVFILSNSDSVKGVEISMIIVNLFASILFWNMTMRHSISVFILLYCKLFRFSGFWFLVDGVVYI